MFVVVEGMDGSGKSTLISNLALYFYLHQLRISVSEEPNREVLLSNEIQGFLSGIMDFTNTQIALAFALNRSLHLTHYEKSLIDPNCITIFDRYIMSSLVYQVADGVPIDVVYAMNYGIRVPDLTLYIDIGFETACSRVASRGKPTEIYETKWHQRQQQYEAAASYLAQRGHRIVRLDGNLSSGKLAAQAIDVIMGTIDSKNLLVT